MPRRRVEIDHARLKEIVENAWMQLGDTSGIRVDNPLERRSVRDVEDPLGHLLDIIRNPRYFYFTCKHILNKILPPIQLAILHELWHRTYPMLIGSRGLGKSFLLALYIMLRALLCQGVKIVIVGAGFRQAKVVFEYCEEIWYSAPILRDICSDSDKNGPRRDVDRCTFRLGDSFIVALPLGDGQKIRGQRAHIIVADEFATIPNEVFENVVSGFAAVSMDPIEKVKEEASRQALRDIGVDPDEFADKDGDHVVGLKSNQTIISGTAYYGFNHFHDYWRKWKSIVESRGDARKLEEIFQGKVPAAFDWRDYAVMRIPYTSLPDGIMDAKNVAKQRATIHSTQFGMEYGACFATDSNGFYKRSLIERCVVGKPANPIVHRSCGLVSFAPALRGGYGCRYVIAVDPAAVSDNFSIVVLELWPDHRRVVHCWVTTKVRHGESLKRGIVKEENFYSYGARKIRDLLRLFRAERIAIDEQGGGLAVMEALADGSQLHDGERRLLPVVVPDKPADTDNVIGDHIIEPISFAKADWVAEANHGMRKDFEDQVLLFPEFDSAALGMAIEEDKIIGRVKIGPDGQEKLYDTLEDCYMNIEELKDELATIQHGQTSTLLRDRWDTPEIKLPGNKKGRMRKDRYSALLMANMVARTLQRAVEHVGDAYMGGFAHELGASREYVARQTTWQNPEWYTDKSERPGYGAVVRH